MNSVTKVYPDAGARVLFTIFGRQIELQGVYSITEMEDKYYINTIYYPFHFEIEDTEISVLTQVQQDIRYYTVTVE